MAAETRGENAAQRRRGKRALNTNNRGKRVLTLCEKRSCISGGDTSAGAKGGKGGLQPQRNICSGGGKRTEALEALSNYRKGKNGSPGEAIFLNVWRVKKKKEHVELCGLKTGKKERIIGAISP